MGEKLLFPGGSVYVDGRFQQADLLVEDGRIAAIGQLNPAGLRVKNLGGRMLVPGFLDLHTHGGDGVDVNAATAQDFGKISRFFARHGTTGWLCSILTDTPEQTLWCIGQAKAAMEAPADGASTWRGPSSPQSTRVLCRSTCCVQETRSCFTSTSERRRAPSGI